MWVKRGTAKARQHVKDLNRGGEFSLAIKIRSDSLLFFVVLEREATLLEGEIASSVSAIFVCVFLYVFLACYVSLQDFYSFLIAICFDNESPTRGKSRGY